MISQYSFDFQELRLREQNYRRIRNVNVSALSLVREAKSEIEQAISTGTDPEKTQHINRASELYARAFKERPYLPEVVQELKGWLNSDSEPIEKKLTAGLALVDLRDQQGVNEKERLKAIEVIKQYQHLVYMPLELKDRIDLQVHSFRSDGLGTPAGMVVKAWRNGMKAIGMIDHNDFAHIYEAVKAGEILGIEVLPGVEFDVVDEGRNIKNMHIISYFKKGSAEEYKTWIQSLMKGEVYQELQRLKTAYIAKTAKMVENFNQRRYQAEDGSGVVLRLEEQDLRGFLTDTPNRYQLGEALFKKYGAEKLGVEDHVAATKKYFGEAEEWDWRSEDLESKTATYIKLKPDGLELDKIVKFAAIQGGTLILPHPGEFIASKDQTVDPNTSREEKVEILKKLLEDYAVIRAGSKAYLGIRGVELFSSKNKPEDIEEFGSILEEFNSKHEIYKKYPLIATTGSDTHSQPGNYLGIGSTRQTPEGNIPWLVSTYLFLDKLRYQMALTSAQDNYGEILSRLGVAVPSLPTEYQKAEYAYWANEILKFEDAKADAVERGLEAFLQFGDFRHLTAESKKMVLKGLSYMVEKTGKTAQELISKAQELAQGVEEGQGKIVYSYFLNPPNRIKLAEALGVNKIRMMGDWFKAWVVNNGSKLFLGSLFGLTAGFMGLFAGILGLPEITRFGASEIGLIAALEAVGAPLFFKVSELITKYVGSKLTDDLILPEEDMATYGFEKTIIPGKAFSIFVYNLGGVKNRESYIEETLRANPGVPIVIFSYLRGEKLKPVKKQIEEWNKKYGAGYPGGKAVLLMSQANPWWEGPAPSPKHGNLEDLYEWLADMDRGFESTNPADGPYLEEINSSHRTLEYLRDTDVAKIQKPVLTFYDENFNPTEEPQSLQKVKEIVLAGKNSTEQIKNLVRKIFGQKQVPIWYTRVRGKAMFNPEYIKRSYRWVKDPDTGLGKVVVETWAVWEDPETGKKTYLRERKALFDEIIGDKEVFAKVVNAIPLDGDNEVPLEPKTGIGNGIRLIQKAMAEVNQPVLDEETMSIKEGYGVIQPMQIIGNIDRSSWAETMARERTRMLFDQKAQMNILLSGADYGKNLKVVKDNQGRGIAGWVLRSTGNGRRGGRRNSVKPSPDLGEGAFLRTAFALDLAFLEQEQPTSYLADAPRTGKWGVGDLINFVQEPPFLPWMVNGQGVWVRNPASMIDRWRVASNALGVGVNFSFPLWVSMWGISGFLGMLIQTGVITPEVGWALFGSTVGSYILLSKVIPAGKRFMVGDFVRTQALMNNIVKLPAMQIKNMYRFLTGGELQLRPTREYNEMIKDLKLSNIYLKFHIADGKVQVPLMFWSTLIGAAITGGAIGTDNISWLTWGSPLIASLLGGGLLAYFTGRTRDSILKLAQEVESDTYATGHRMIGEAWDRVARESGSSKAARLKDVLEAMAFIRGSIYNRTFNVGSILTYLKERGVTLGKNVTDPIFFARTIRDLLVKSAEEGEDPTIEKARQAIWDNLTRAERQAFTEVANGDEAQAKELFFSYIQAISDKVIQKDLEPVDVKIAEMNLAPDLEAKARELYQVLAPGLWRKLSQPMAMKEARRRVKEVVRASIEQGMEREQILQSIERSINLLRFQIELAQWLEENPAATLSQRIDKEQELMAKYGLDSEE